jgi:hypothetical protein
MFRTRLACFERMMQNDDHDTIANHVAADPPNSRTRCQDRRNDEHLFRARDEPFFKILEVGRWPLIISFHA